jgi:hypothetical protein
MVFLWIKKAQDALIQTSLLLLDPERDRVCILKMMGPPEHVASASSCRLKSQLPVPVLAVLDTKSWWCGPRRAVARRTTRSDTRLRDVCSHRPRAMSAPRGRTWCRPCAEAWPPGAAATLSKRLSSPSFQRGRELTNRFFGSTTQRGVVLLHIYSRSCIRLGLQAKIKNRAKQLPVRWAIQKMLHVNISP